MVEPRERSVRRKPNSTGTTRVEIGRWTVFGLVTLLVGGAYWRWFVPGVLTYGDWPFLYNDYVKSFLSFPESWSTYYSGLGQFASVSILSVPLILSQGIVAQLGVSYAVIERLFFFIPIVVMAPLSTYLLLRYLFGKRLIATVGALFYTVNTYAVISFGVLGHVAGGVAYALAPLVVWLAIRAWERNRWSDRLLAGLAVVLQIQYDIRFTYLTAGVFLSYALFRLLYVRKPSIASQLRSLAISLAVIGGVVVVLGLYWILPAVFSPGSAPTPPESNLNPGWVHALSFVTPGHALALFHPFWNVLNLSNVQPVPWYFYLWPVMAFSAGLAVWYLPKPRHSVSTGDWRVVWLIFLALASAFLVMGTKAPLSGIYEWLFAHVPGFNAFRDPSKHFMTLALAYAGLIGVTVYAVTRWLVKTVPMNYRPFVKWLPLGLFCLLLLTTMRQDYFSRVYRSFITVGQPPAEYIKLKRLNDQDKRYYRTLWVPNMQRFGRYYLDHPAFPAYLPARASLKTFLTDPKKPDSWLDNPNAEYLLSAMSVKYVVVPDDPHDEIFRDFGPRDSYLERLDALPFLKRLSGFNSLAVYENRHFADHIYPASTVNYFSAREASLNFPELDRLEGQYDQVVDRPALMFWRDSDVTRKPKYGWELLDMAQSEQRPGQLQAPFTVPVGGTYQLWAHRSNQDASVSAVTVTTTGGNQIYRQDDPGRAVAFYDLFGEPVYESVDSDAAELLQSGFVQLGEAPLPPGPYRLQVTDDTIQGNSDPTNASFEQSVKAGLATSSDHTDGRRSLQMSGRDEIGKILLNARNYDPTAFYRVTFDYRNVRGYAPWYSLHWAGKEDRSPVPLLTQSRDWQRFSTVVSPSESSTGFKLGLLSGGRPRSFTVNRFDNVRIAKVDGIDALFLRTTTPDVPLPEVTFKQRSSTRYTAHVRGARGPFYLVFAESYHPGWKLTVPGEDSSDLEKSHVMMNGYANAWRLDRTGDYDVEIEFIPQRLVVLGTVLSGVALVILLVILRVAIRRRR